MLYILTLSGSIIAAIISIIASLIMKDFSKELIFEIILGALTAFTIATVSCGTTIPLTYKFGTEKARILMAIFATVPILIIRAVSSLLKTLNLDVSDSTVFTAIIIPPLFSLAWNYIMYRISYNVFAKKDI